MIGADSTKTAQTWLIVPLTSGVSFGVLLNGFTRLADDVPRDAYGQAEGDAEFFFDSQVKQALTIIL